VLNNLANLASDRGDVKRAHELLTEVLARDETHYGPAHPRTAGTLSNLAAANRNLGRWTEAEAMARRAVAIREKHGSGGHIDTSMALLELARTVAGQGRRAEAEGHLKRGLKIAEAAKGVQQERLSAVLLEFAQLRIEQRRFSEAEVMVQRALALWTKAPDAEIKLSAHAQALEVQGELELARGRHRQALAIYARVGEAYEKLVGVDSPDYASALFGQGKAELKAGHPEKAISLLEQSLRILEKSPVPVEQRNQVKAALEKARVAGSQASLR
jgi:tetratricopeptide (TPR) repeat protein